METGTLCGVEPLFTDNPVGRYISSADMVPGDVYEVSDPALVQFPADSVLLSGDCIVNESMLTGMNT